MGISTATTLASAIVALIAPALIQASKRIFRPRTGLVGLAFSILLGVIAVAATGCFEHSPWGVVLAAVVGVSQAAYTLINQAFEGKLSKDAIDAKAIANDDYFVS